MAIDDVPAFLADLQKAEGVSPRALEFTNLSAARSGETLGATWSEIDLERRIWTVPAPRIKGERGHRVPLIERMVEIIQEMAKIRHSEFVFPGARKNAPQSNMNLAMTLRRPGADITVDGFHSTFRDWASEWTSFPHEVAEMALAHTIASKTEAAYRRGDLFEKRRQMMEAWAIFALSHNEKHTVWLGLVENLKAVKAIPECANLSQAKIAEIRHDDSSKAKSLVGDAAGALPRAP